jgi:uncharacterized FlaG/YvyC family protein
VITSSPEQRTIEIEKLKETKKNFKLVILIALRSGKVEKTFKKISYGNNFNFHTFLTPFLINQFTDGIDDWNCFTLYYYEGTEINFDVKFNASQIEELSKLLANESLELQQDEIIEESEEDSEINIKRDENQSDCTIIYNCSTLGAHVKPILVQLSKKLNLHISFYPKQSNKLGFYVVTAATERILEEIDNSKFIKMQKKFANLLVIILRPGKVEKTFKCLAIGNDSNSFFLIFLLFFLQFLLQITRCVPCFTLYIIMEKLY